MIEDEVLKLVAKKFQISKDNDLVARKIVRRNAEIWIVSDGLSMNSEKYVLKHSSDDLSRQAGLWMRAEQLMDDNPEFVSLAATYESHFNVILSRMSNFPTLRDLAARNGYPNPLRWYGELGQVIDLAGNWLKAYHRFDARKGSISEPLIRYILSRDNTRENLPDNLHDRLLEFAANCPDNIVAPIHCDFSPGNILSNGHQLSVIDFGDKDFREMSPLWDIATLVIAVERHFSFRFKSPLKWIPMLRHNLIDRFTESYGFDPKDSNYVWRSCCAVRHFALCSDKLSSNTRSMISDWHIGKIEQLINLANN